MMHQQQVLCLPRDCIDDRERFTPWDSADWLLDAAESGMTWLPRWEAEMSADFVQPIPCALVLGTDSGFHVFRRVKGGRLDLSDRLTLVVGGHIEPDLGVNDFSGLVTNTLRREIDEELDVTLHRPVNPVGVVIDYASPASSRHIGIVHEVVAESSVKPLATEEFAPRSKYAGRKCEPGEINSLRSNLDPWSSIIFSAYVASPLALDVGLQLPFQDFLPRRSAGTQLRLPLSRR